MLGCCHGFEVQRIIPLHPFDEFNAEAGSQVCVLAKRFLTAPPTRVAEDVDVRRPEGESGIQARVAAALRILILGPRLVGNRAGDLADQRGVKGGSSGSKAESSLQQATWTTVVKICD
jgi:hypothetical protein